MSDRKDAWHECGCCDVVCPEPLVVYESCALSRAVCGFFKQDGDQPWAVPADYVLPLEQYENYSRVETFSHSWTETLAGGSVTVSRTKSYTLNDDYSFTNLVDGVCDQESRKHGSGSATYDSTEDRGMADVFDGCGNPPVSTQVTATSSYSGTFGIDTDVAPGFTASKNLTDVYESPDVEHVCPGGNVTMWDGSYQTDNSSSTVYGGLWAFTEEDGEEATVVHNYSNKVTWASVVAAIDAVFDDDCEAGVLSKSGYTKVGSSYLGETYDDCPASITKVKSKVRFQIPDTFVGSWYEVRYEIWKTHDDTEVETLVSADAMEWSGPGDVSDAESWLTEWVDIPLIADHSVEMRAVSYRCYHGGKWQSF